MNNLAGAYRDAGRVDRAIALLEEAWEKFKATSGPDHPDTLRCLKNLAIVSWRGGPLERAIPLLREAFERIEARRGVICLRHTSAQVIPAVETIIGNILCRPNTAPSGEVDSRVYRFGLSR